MAQPVSFCTVDGCSARVHGNGLCNRHYRRMMRTGQTDGPENGRDGRGRERTQFTCSECDRPAVSRGYCRVHYKRLVLDSADRPRCSVDGCDRPVNSKGLCEYHYNLLRDTGSTDPPTRKSVTERFWEKVDRGGPDDCWLFKGGSGGHGKFWDGQSLRNAHAFSYELAHGSVPVGMHLHHFKCENKRCVNPAHLRPETPSAHIIETMIGTLRKMGYTVIEPE